MKTGMYRNMSNEQLVMEYRETGNEAVFEALHTNVKGLIYKVALKFRGIPGYDLDDLVSEGYIDLLKAIEKFNPNKGSSFTTFLYQELNCFYIDLLRVAEAGKRNGDVQSMEEIIHGAGEDDLSERGSLFFSVECSEYNYIELMDMIKRLNLTKQERVSVNLLAEGYGKKEIAERIGTNAPAVYCYLNRVAAKLKFSLQTA